MPGSTLYLSFPDRAALLRELGANLAHGRAFVGGAKGFELFSPCTLVLQHPELPDQLHIACEVVMVQAEGPMAGVAVQFTDRGEQARASLQAFVAAEPSCPDLESHELEGESPLDELAEFDEPDAEGTPRPRLNLSQERRDRLRNLPAAARMKVAQGPVLEDRVLLERIYGNVVWEMLLHNPRISVPEVAAMARKGTLPRPLLELIANNEQWIRLPVVRRALLANPRLPTDSALKVLRCLSARELKLVPQQTAYPTTVRQAAQRLLRGG
ncbi:MAG: hypothetical protein QM778_36065 [Myxococcales bacterium]